MFDGGSIQEFIKRYNIQHFTTALYFPEGNGSVERFNRVIKGIIKLSNSNNLNCEKELLNMVCAYRLAVCDSTKHSLFELMSGRSPHSKDNAGWLSNTARVNWSSSVVRGNLVASQNKVKGKFDSKHNVKQVNFKIGDVVKVKKGRIVKKGESKFTETPPAC